MTHQQNVTQQTHLFHTSYIKLQEEQSISKILKQIQQYKCGPVS